eukprot:TRINITY_DN9902_c0_g2_i1.p1 TRINITY_DN9902_c0_g2~~TRINITY_DN9902_c0_g2_i1.p1  ORF type:complete len:316 (+),score=32.03 TRINITY_DN9902_c0_g2_i1:196-1143(+)
MPWLLLLLLLEWCVASPRINRTRNVFSAQDLRDMRTFVWSSPLVQGNTLTESFRGSGGMGIAFTNESWGFMQRAFPEFYQFARAAVTAHPEDAANVFYGNLLTADNMGEQTDVIADWHFDNTVESVVEWATRFTGRRMDWGLRVQEFLMAHRRQQCGFRESNEPEETQYLTPHRVSVLYLNSVDASRGGAFCVRWRQHADHELRHHCSQPQEGVLMEFDGRLSHQVQRLVPSGHRNLSTLKRNSFVLEQYSIPNSAARKIFGRGAQGSVYITSTTPSDGHLAVLRMNARNGDVSKLRLGQRGWLVRDGSNNWRRA